MADFGLVANLKLEMKTQRVNLRTQKIPAPLEPSIAGTSRHSPLRMIP
jgi:hypothetical protein